MLSITLVEEIDRLLQVGTLSQRKIAARLGVSRGTVGAIASGQRGIFGKEPDAEDGDPSTNSAPAERCSRCGFRVYMPCLVCRTREYRQAQRVQQELAEICGRVALRGRRRKHGNRRRRPRRSRVA